MADEPAWAQADLDARAGPYALDGDVTGLTGADPVVDHAVAVVVEAVAGLKGGDQRGAASPAKRRVAGLEADAHPCLGALLAWSGGAGVGLGAAAGAAQRDAAEDLCPNICAHKVRRAPTIDVTGARADALTVKRDA